MTVLKALLALAVFCWGTVESSSFSLWPLFSYEEEGGRKSLEVLGPLFFWQREGEEVNWGLRPLVSRTVRPGYNRWEYLYPLGKYERRDGRLKAYLAPLWLTRREEGRRKDTTLLTAFWGRTEKGEGYGGVFPLYGVFKDRFRRDRIEFFLWPLWSRIEDEGTVTEKILWPLLQRSRGRERGFCLWPLYCKKERPGDRKGYILWPFYIWRDKGVEGGMSKMRLYFPFYASIRSPRQRSDIYLPPFFHYKKVLQPPYERWETPWPFVTWDRYEEGVFPLYRLRREPQKERRYILWPLYVYEWDQMGGQEMVTRRFLLINRSRVVRSPEEVLEKDLNLWPLFSYKRGRKGADFYSLQPLPFRHEGLERNLYPLFWIVRYRSSPGGHSLFDLLWGLFRLKRGPEGTSWRIAFLLEGRSSEGKKELSILGGLIRLRQTGGKIKLKLLSFHSN